ncbi:histidinol dehydrogenase [Patulibacter sp. S7RM1-6]
MDNDRPMLERGSWKAMPSAERDAFLTRGTAAFDPKLREGVLEIIEDVRQSGDAGLLRALEKFDGITIPADRIRVRPEEFAAAREQVSAELLTAIRDLVAHLRSFNEQLMAHGDWRFESEPGLVVGERVTPIASAGLFVPSGKGSYPSVMAQLGTPAVVAGVQEIAVIVPPIPGSDGAVDPAVLVVADELGIRNVFRANGPAGVAALAFGTESVPKVRKVMGPGSSPVACAQIEVQRYGTASVMLLGPSESLIIADASTDPYRLAADLLNEAEHGPDSSSVLVTDSAELLDAVQAEIARQLADLPAPRDEYVRKALHNGGAILTSGVEESAEVTNAFAPEHMQIATADPHAVLPLIQDAGEILLGQNTTVAMANFVIGCPAALPTGTFAKVAGGVTVEAFLKKSAVAEASDAAMRRVAETVVQFARHEGFPAHAASMTRRVERTPAG